MDFRNILQSLNNISEGDVSHKAGPGGYGNRHGSETVTDQYGKKVGKVSLASLAPKDDTPKKQGRPKNPDAPKTGEDDPKNKKVADLFGRTTGDVPTGKKGTEHGLSANEKEKKKAEKKAEKKSLKEFIEDVETNQQLDESEVAEAKPSFSRNALDLKPVVGAGPSVTTVPIIPNNMPGGANMPAGGGPRWIKTNIPFVKSHQNVPPTVTPAGGTPKLPSNYQQPAISRVAKNTQIDKEFSNFLKGQTGQTFGKSGSGRGEQGGPTAAELRSAPTMSKKTTEVPADLISPNYKGSSIKAGSNPKLGSLGDENPGVKTDLGRMGSERPGANVVFDPAFDLPRGPGSGLDEADDFGVGPGGPRQPAGPIGAGPERNTNTGVPDTKNYKAPLTDKYGSAPGSHAGGWDAAGQQKYIDRTSPSVVNKIKDKLGLDMPDSDYGPRPDERERLMKTHPVQEDGEKWIQKAIKHPGALTKKAKAAGQSTKAFAKAHAHDKGTTGKQARLAQTLSKMHEATDLPGNQDKLDVAEPKGKLTSADFKALSKKKKVKESKIMSIVESINFKELMANADADVQEMLMELQNDVEMFKETGHSSDLLDSFLKVHLHKKKKITDEAMFDEEVGAGRGVVNPPVVNPNTPAPAARTASPGWGKDDYKPLVPDTSTTFKPAVTDPEGVKEAGSFIRGLASSRKTFEGKEMKDVQLESWEKELNNLLNEGITVSTSTGQQGAPDSVSINATDNDANELLNILRQSGMGVFGGNDKPAMTPYGVVSQGEEEPTGTGTEPEMSPEVVGDGDDMLSLLKKMSGLSAGPVGQEPEGTASSDYEDEEGAEEVDEQYLSEPIAPIRSPDDPQAPSTPAPPPATPGSDGTNEGEVEEGNKFTGNLAKARAAGKKEADLDGDGDMEKVREGHDHEECNECGYAMESCKCDHEEQVEEGFSNDAGGDAMANTELAKLKALLSMGGDLHKMKRDQSVLNPTQVSMAESLAQWKRLSGIK